MQREEIDRDEYENIRSELTGIVEIIGSVTIIEGRHKDHGSVILIRQAGRFFVDADDATHIREKDERARREPIINTKTTSREHTAPIRP